LIVILADMHPTGKKPRPNHAAATFIADAGVSGNHCISLRRAQTALAARFAWRDDIAARGNDGP